MIISTWNKRRFLPEEAPEMVDLATSEKIVLVKNNKNIAYYNIPCVLDLECSSLYIGKTKYSVMYAWVVGINGVTMIGRTWEQMLQLFEYVGNYFELSDHVRMIFYVHNLSYDFQCFRRWFRWKKVFALNERRVCYALSDAGVEFRCSYILSGYPLEIVGKNLIKYKVEKMIGDLDYNKIRHPGTPLRDNEIGYIDHDGLVVMAYIQERIEEDGDITKIPLTKTGYVRRYCKNQCLYAGIPDHKKAVFPYMEYRQLMKILTLEPEEYAAAKRAFAGGFTHASAWHSGKTMHDVFSMDETSAYPAMMVAEKYPMSKGVRVVHQTKEEFDRNITLYCCIFDVEFWDLESTQLCENPMSASKCWKREGVVEDNGRIVEADHVGITITDVDFRILSKFYRWSHMRVGVLWRYQRGYLPKRFVESILNLYAAKTKLKGVEGMEAEYMKSKEGVNSAFGMAVTDVVRDEQVYDDELGWCDPIHPDLKEAIEKENDRVTRFLYYPWGVFVTSYARARLLSAILELGPDYIYSDTDSTKGMHIEKHREWYLRDNDRIRKKIERALQANDLPVELASPRTIKGVEKPLGAWEYENDEKNYSRFKTLGAKRYMTEIEGEISLTVSGVNKTNAIPYLLAEYGPERIFDAFDEDLIIPAKNTKHPGLLNKKGIPIDVPTGKMTHTYLDDEYTITVRDYLGNVMECHELSGVHMEGAEYSLSLSDAYVSYLMGIREVSK